MWIEFTIRNCLAFLVSSVLVRLSDPALISFVSLSLSLFFPSFIHGGLLFAPFSFTSLQRQLALIGLFNCFALMVCPLMEAAILVAAGRNQCMELESLIWVLCP